MWCSARGAKHSLCLLKGRENKRLQVEAATLMKFLGWLLKCFFKYLPRSLIYFYFEGTCDCILFNFSK